MANKPRWSPGHHPTPEELLQAREDELAVSDAEPILAHIQHCWECQARVEQFKRGVDAWLQFRKSCVDPAVAPRPGGWLRLSARLRDAEEPAAPRRAPIGGRFWLAVSSAVAVLVGATMLVLPARLTAQAVLDRAIRAETAPGASLAPARIIARRAGRVIAADRSLLTAARIDSGRPLSVRSYREWHDSLATKTDSVATIGREIRIQTSTPEGLVALAWLTVTSATYQSTARHVELRDGATIDVSPAEPESRPTEETRAPSPLGTPGAAPAAESTEALEMEARWVLHRIGADLGDPLQIEASGGRVVVSGTLDDASRKEQIVDALRGLARVEIRIRVASGGADLISNARPIDTGTSGVKPLLTPQLSKDLEDPQARTAFVSQALRLSQTILRHSWALQRLAERYPAAGEGALRPETKASLRRLVEAHEEAIGSAMQIAAALWKPYAQLELAATRSGPEWQNVAGARLRAAQSFDHLTVRMLAAGAEDGLTVQEALDQMRLVFRELR